MTDRKVAKEDLIFPNGTKAYNAGDEVSPAVAERYGWNALLVGHDTKTAKELRHEPVLKPEDK